jgi:ribosomal protein L11 methyltransferase
VSFFQNQGEGLKLPQKFDLIVSNILAAPLISLAEDFAKLSQGSARLILSGFLDSGMAQIVEFYGKNGFKEEKVINNNKWITLIFAKE